MNKLNEYWSEHPNLNNGEKTKFYSVLPAEDFKRMLDEIFDVEHYKKGKVKNDMVIVDAGANCGLTAWYFKDVAKMIYAIEPSKIHYEALVKNTKDLTNVKTFNMALSCQNAKETLYSHDGGEVPESFWGNGKIEEVVETIALDTFMENNNIDHIDLLKIDIEGAEFVIFPSNSFRRAAKKVDYIIGEGHTFGNLNHDVIPLMLKDAGFKAVWIPIKNFYVKVKYIEQETGEIREYRKRMKTLFWAERIKNE